MCKYDIPVYIGKADSNTPEATNICKVLYIDIRSGAAVVFNRATKKYETIRRTEARCLDNNLQKLAEDTQHLDKK
nr:MAG TPA: hypothetical protein [Caudoviricetes sp.]